MELKPSKIIFSMLVFTFSVLNLPAQYEYVEDTVQQGEGIIPESDTAIIYQEESVYGSSEFDSELHFSDSDQYAHDNAKLHSKFNEKYWKELRDKLNFDEDTLKEEKDSFEASKLKIKRSDGTDLSFLKYIFIIAAIAILIFVLVRILPGINERNIKNRQKLIIRLEDLNEEEIKAIEIDTPLMEALRRGDYKTAYRLRYLDTMKKLIARNLIFYKKEKTNYEYLLQLTGKPVYEPFRMLTFNFDGIWYGDIAINKEIYEGLEIHFLNFNEELIKT